MPVIEAIFRFCAEIGVLPTEGKLDRYRRDRRFRMAGIKGRYQDYLPEAIALIESRGLPTPPPYEQTKRLKVTWPTSDGTLDPDHPEHTKQYSIPEVLRWVERYLQQLPAGKAATYLGWAAFSSDHPDCPATGTIAKYGGLDVLVARASRPGAIEEAEAEHAAAQEAAARERTQAAAVRPQAQAVMQAMYELGGTFIWKHELAEYMGWHPQTVDNWLEALRAAGKVEVVDARVGRKSYRYQLTGLDLTEEELERLAFEAEARRPQPRRIMELLGEHGTLDGHQLAEALPLGYIQTLDWVRNLRRAGLVEPLKPQNKRRHGGYRLTKAGRDLLSRFPPRVRPDAAAEQP